MPTTTSGGGTFNAGGACYRSTRDIHGNLVDMEGARHPPQSLAFGSASQPVAHSPATKRYILQCGRAQQRGRGKAAHRSLSILQLVHLQPPHSHPCAVATTGQSFKRNQSYGDCSTIDDPRVKKSLTGPWRQTGATTLPTSTTATDQRHKRTPTGRRKHGPWKRNSSHHEREVATADRIRSPPDNRRLGPLSTTRPRPVTPKGLTGSLNQQAHALAHTTAHVHHPLAPTRAEPAPHSRRNAPS